MLKYKGGAVDSNGNGRQLATYKQIADHQDKCPLRRRVDTLEVHMDEVRGHCGDIKTDIGSISTDMGWLKQQQLQAQARAARWLGWGLGIIGAIATGVLVTLITAAIRSG
jgi:hypothetical protein